MSNQEQRKEDEKKQLDKIDNELKKAEQYLKQNSIPSFHILYTLQTLRNKLQSGQDQIAEKLIKSSVKIYRSLYKRIQTRKSLKINIDQYLKNKEQIPEDLLIKFKECTKKTIKDINYWSKVVGYSEQSQEKEFPHDGKNYLEIILTDNQQILALREDYADLQYNPLFLKKDEVQLQENVEYLETIEKIKRMSQKSAKMPYHSSSQKIEENKRQKETEEIVEEEDKEKSIIKDYEIYESPPTLKKSEFDILKKYKSLAGTPKVINRYYKGPIKKKQNDEKSINKKSSLDPYLKKLSLMKSRIEDKSPKKEKTQENIEIGLNLIDSVRQNRIRFIAEKIHQKGKEESNNFEHQIFNVTKSKSIPSLTFHNEKSKEKKRKKKVQQQFNTLRQSKSKLVPLALEHKTMNLQRSKQMDHIGMSLKNLKGRIKESNISPEKNLSKSYFKSLDTSMDRDQGDMKEQKKEKKFDNQLKISRNKIVDKKIQKQFVEKIETVEKTEEKVEQIKNEKIEEVNKKKEELKEEEENKLRKTLYSKKKHLESIMQDIQNQNIERIETINHEKLKQKKIEENILQKKYRIQELQEKVKFYQDDKSDRNEEQDADEMEKLKKRKMEAFQKEKGQILKQAKKIQQHMLEQEEKFVNLKEKQIQIREADIQEKYAEINKIAVAQMEEKTKKLQQTIEAEERKRKLHEQELQEQVQKNQLINRELEKQDELEKLLIQRIEAITKNRESKREAEKEKKKRRMKEEIEQLENTHKKVLLEYQRDSERLGSMFQAMRKKNVELQAKIKSRTKDENEILT